MGYFDKVNTILQLTEQHLFLRIRIKLPFIALRQARVFLNYCKWQLIIWTSLKFRRISYVVNVYFLVPFTLILHRCPLVTVITIFIWGDTFIEIGWPGIDVWVSDDALP